MPVLDGTIRSPFGLTGSWGVLTAPAGLLLFSRLALPTLHRAPPHAVHRHSTRYLGARLSAPARLPACRWGIRSHRWLARRAACGWRPAPRRRPPRSATGSSRWRWPQSAGWKSSCSCRPRCGRRGGGHLSGWSKVLSLIVCSCVFLAPRGEVGGPSGWVGGWVGWVGGPPWLPGQAEAPSAAGQHGPGVLGSTHAAVAPGPAAMG